MPIYIDADACPVKEEVYRVARRYGIKVFVVANAPIRVPADELIELVVVRGGFDAADDRIVEGVAAGDIVITTDIPLADRCLRAAPGCWGPKGDEFTEDAIGQAPGDPRPARHAAAVGRVRRRARAVCQGRSLEVPRQARRTDPRGAAG